MIIILQLQRKKFTEEDGSFHFKNIKYIYTKKIFLLSENLGDMTAYVLNHKGEEVISERDIKISKKNIILKSNQKLYQIYLVLQILILMTFNLYSKIEYLTYLSKSPKVE
jgi:hypothetical protein